MTITSFDGKQIDLELTGGDGVMVQGKLVGTTTGADAYQIPVTIWYPKGAFTASNKAMVELRNSTLHEQFGSIKFELEAMRGLLMTGGGLTGSNKYMVEDNGHVLIEATVNQFVFNLEGGLGLVSPYFPFYPGGQVPYDAAIGIVDPADVDEILADLSTFARAPGTYFSDAGSGPLPAAIPTATHVIAAGYSQSAMMWRDFLDRGQNSALGGGFPNSLVYEGTFLGGCGSRTRQFTAAAPFYASYGFSLNETPGTEGDVMQVDTEMAVSGLQGIDSRLTGALAHYAHLEVRGTPHIPQDFIPVGMQNTGISLNPWMRSAWENLLAKVVSGTPFPAGYDDSVYAMEGLPDVRPGGSLFPAAYANSGHPAPVFSTTVVFEPVIGDDLNWKSALPVPHALTLTASGGQLGAPLGQHRAFSCLYYPGVDINLDKDAVKDCPALPPLGGAELSLCIAGIYVPPTRRERDRNYKDLAAFLGLYEAAFDACVDLGVLSAGEKAEMIAEATARYNAA